MPAYLSFQAAVTFHRHPYPQLFILIENYSQLKRKKLLVLLTQSVKMNLMGIYFELVFF